jgi:microcystin degradation protein MlrC
MRIAIGSMMQETNTFAPFPTTIQSFRNHYLRRGQDVVDGFGAARVEVPGFLSILQEAGAEPVGLIACHAGSGGPLQRADFNELVDELVEQLVAAAPVDGVLLALHGAMGIEDEPDAEAEIIRRVHAVLPPNTPVGVSLDLHGHITEGMLQPDTFLIGYREYPHIDMFETGQRVARLLLDRLSRRVQPIMALAKRPMIVSPIGAVTTNGPLQSLMAAARKAEHGPVLHASLFPVQPWLDVPGLGFAALVCADRDIDEAQAAADRLAELAWRAREDFKLSMTPLEEAIRIGLQSDGVTVVSDGGDAPSSGAAADHAGVLRALLSARADHENRLSYVTLCDAEAARAAAAVGIGKVAHLRIGHKQNRDGEPIEVTGTVKTISDGSFVMHDAGAQGSRVEMGVTVVLAIGAIRLAIRSFPTYEWDTGVFTSVGLDLRDAALVFVKSPSHFRVAFSRFASRILVADTPGASCGNLRRVKFTRVTRPLYPLDEFD